MNWTWKKFWGPTVERGLRGGVAAIIGVYVAGNLVFDTTNVSGSLEHIASIFIGGVASALGISVVGNAVTKNGPSLNNAETTK